MLIPLTRAQAGTRLVDGNPSDWTGTAPTVAHTDAQSGDEWIVAGAASDRRAEANMTDDNDLTELRLTVDSTYLYVLIRMADITDANKVYVSLGFDTDQSLVDTSYGFLGDESGLGIERPLMQAERVLVFHTVGGGSPVIEWYDGGLWYGIGGAEIAVSTTNNVIEVRLPLNDLNGLTATSDFILTLATFQNDQGWNNDKDTTLDYFGNDAVDVLSTPGQSGNAWDRDLNNNSVYFGWWVQLQGAGAAPTAVVWERLYHSQCDQLTANGCPASDHPAEQFVPSGGESIRFTTARRYSVDGTLAPGGTTDVIAFDDEPVTLRLMAHQNDLSAATLRYGTTSGSPSSSAAMTDIDTWTGTWNGTTSLAYDIFQGTIPSQAPGDVFYFFQARDGANGERAVCRYENQAVVALVNRTWVGQWVRDASCPAGQDYAYTVLDDDMNGPAISAVTFTDNGSSDQVCAALADTTTRSGDNDSGVASALVRYNSVKGDLESGIGATAAMALSSGSTWCSSQFDLPGSAYYRVEATNGDNDRTGDAESSAGAPLCAGSCAGGSSGASPSDYNVWWNNVYHNTRDLYYRSPFGAVPTGQAVTIRLRTTSNDLDDVALAVYNTPGGTHWYLQSTPETVDGATAIYKFTISASDTANPQMLYYKFRLRDGADGDPNSDCDWYVDDHAHNAYDHEDRYENGTGIMAVGKAGDPCSDSATWLGDNSFNIMVYDAAAYANHLDAWSQGAAIYQILPDRFRNGDITNDSAWPYNDVYGTVEHIHAAWNEPVDNPRDPTSAWYQHWSADFFGGDLQGIIDELDYLQSIGVTAIYLNPVFDAPSNHGYDTTNYLKINPRYGDNALFATLNTEAEARGIKLILDGVFNHTGSDSIYFDRPSHWDADGDAVEGNNSSGACESASSVYSAFYTFLDTVGPCYSGKNYESWWGYDTLPLLNENSAVKDYIFDYVSNDNSNGLVAPLNHVPVIQYWASQGADGWRFDVADEISHTFWQNFRSQVKNLDNLNGPLYSEVWYEAQPWLYGDQLDATMNYRYRKAVLGFLVDSDWTDNDSEADRVVWKLAPSQFDYALKSIQEDYPKPAFQAMMNLMDSHDTSRALFVLRERSADYPTAIAKMKMMAALQFTYPGAPTIYYGDEVGIGARDYSGYGAWGAGYTSGGIVQDDPYNRASYPWTNQSGTLPTNLPNTDLQSVYQVLGVARRSYDVLRTGEVTTLLVDDSANVYAYARTDSSAPQCAIAIFNRGASAQAVTLSVASLAACQNTTFYNLLPNGATAAGASYASNASALATLTIAPLTSAVLVPAFDNPNTPDAAVSLPAAAITMSSAALGVSHSGSTTVSAAVTDLLGQPIPSGTTISFTLVTGGGSLGQATATTNAGGVASVTYTAPANDTVAVVRASLLDPNGQTVRSGIGVLVEDTVTAAQRASKQTTIGPDTLDALAAVGVKAVKTGNGEPVVTLVAYSGNPHPMGGTGQYARSSFYDVHLSSTAGVTSLQLTFKYTNETGETGNLLYWWNGSSWTVVMGTGQLDTSANTVSFTVTGATTPALSDLDGTPFVVANNDPTALGVVKMESRESRGESSYLLAVPVILILAVGVGWALGVQRVFRRRVSS